MFSSPPQPVFKDGKILNLQEIRDWGKLHDPMWAACEKQAQRLRLNELETFQLLAVWLLRENWLLSTALKAEVIARTSF